MMQKKHEVIRLAEVEISQEAVQLLGHEYALRLLALPIKKEGGHLTVALSDPDNFEKITHLADITGHFIIPVLARDEDLRFYINKIFGEENIDSIALKFLMSERLKNRTGNAEFSAEFLAEISSAPAVRFIDSIIETGILNRASDIHIEPYGDKLRARFRIDGLLSTYRAVDISLLPNVISRLKIMGGLDIAEKRRPQDGRFTIPAPGSGSSLEKVEFRLSTLPTTFGEKAVIRLLFGQKVRLKKENLGFYEDDLKRLTKLFTRPYGAIFMTGPTGSGKSTTLSCFLEELNTEERNIVTVEDPIENPIPGISHVNAERHTLSFASALRHILRQDPDIIMIGEIRDEETARIAIQAAITGHVVLSTLHTNDAAGVVERLADMGIEPYLIAAALNGIISQRLVRLICRECSSQAKLDPRHAALLGLPADTEVYEGKGCVHCNNTGFHSRFAVYEYFIIDDESRRKISTNPIEFSEALRIREGLKKNAIRSLLAGLTTAEEVIRVLNYDC